MSKPILSKSEQGQLIQHALSVREQAYAPYSQFKVGAALLTESGQTFCGCNVENASYGLTLCAERVSCSAAVSAGHRRFKALALATSGGVTPCGACRQFLAEFQPDLSIILIPVDTPTRLREVSLQSLLPDSFQFHPRTDGS